MSRRNDVHEKGDSGLLVLLIISLLQLWQVLIVFSISLKRNLTLIFCNDRKYKDHEQLA